MLHNLIQARRILNKNPKTRRKELLRQTSLNNEEFEYLLIKGIVEKRGKTKGTEWHWVGKKPDYEMVNEFLGGSNLFTSLEKPVNKYEIKYGNITIKFSSDDVSLRSKRGNELSVNDPARLKDILSLLS